MKRDDRFTDLLESKMIELTSAFSEHFDPDITLGHITSAAVDLVDGIDYADVMLIEGGSFRSIAPTAQVVTDLDHAQMRLQQGPCLEAATSDSIVRAPDLRQDERWPAFAAAALENGVHSVLSFQLYSHRTGTGAMNLLGKKPQALDIQSEATLAMLATHAAVTLIAARKEVQFESALASRDVIGQAKGIIMERFKLDATRAFALITKLSQDGNIPVRIIAQQIVDSLVAADTNGLRRANGNGNRDR
jgi:transcriptional regulator with GAF, ATPase, and Fis domain